MCLLQSQFFRRFPNMQTCNLNSFQKFQKFLCGYIQRKFFSEFSNSCVHFGFHSNVSIQTALFALLICAQVLYVHLLLAQAMMIRLRGLLRHFRWGNQGINVTSAKAPFLLADSKQDKRDFCNEYYTEQCGRKTKLLLCQFSPLFFQRAVNCGARES